MFKHLTFIKNLKFDNSRCVRKIPYDGVSWFVIYNKDVEAYKKQYEFLSKKWNLEYTEKIADICDFLFVKGIEMNIQSIKALDYVQINKYVMGESNFIPELLDFNPKIHTIQWYANPILAQGFGRQTLSNLGIPLKLSTTNHQVLIK